MAFARLQRADSDDLARHFLAPLIGDRDDHAVFALLVAHRMLDRTLDPHGRNALSVGLRASGIELQMMLAAGADTGALQNRRLAMRTYSRSAQRARTNCTHC